MWQRPREFPQPQPWKLVAVLFYLTVASSPQVCLRLWFFPPACHFLCLWVFQAQFVPVLLSLSLSLCVSPSLCSVSLSLHPCVSLSLGLLWTLFILPTVASSHLISPPDNRVSSSIPLSCCFFLLLLLLRDGKGAVSIRADPLGDAGLPALHASCHIPAAQGHSFQQHCILADHTHPTSPGVCSTLLPKWELRGAQRRQHISGVLTTTPPAPVKGTGSGNSGNSRKDLHTLTTQKMSLGCRKGSSTQLFPGSQPCYQFSSILF